MIDAARQQSILLRHIVAVEGLVTDLSNSRVLLIRSPKRDWDFPGGRDRLRDMIEFDGTVLFHSCEFERTDESIHEERRVWLR